MTRPRAVVAITAVGSPVSSASNAALTRSFEKSLQKRGFDVSTASDGDAVLELCREVKPAVVVLEVLLANLNGYQVCRQLRIELPHTPTILFSTRDDPADVIWAEAVGARALLHRPDELDKTIELAAELAADATP